MDDILDADDIAAKLIDLNNIVKVLLNMSSRIEEAANDFEKLQIICEKIAGPNKNHLTLEQIKHQLLKYLHIIHKEESKVDPIIIDRMRLIIHKYTMKFGIRGIYSVQMDYYFMLRFYINFDIKKRGHICGANIKNLIGIVGGAHILLYNEIFGKPDIWYDQQRQREYQCITFDRAFNFWD